FSKTTDSETIISETITTTYKTTTVSKTIILHLRPQLSLRLLLPLRSLSLKSSSLKL
ncbi:4805_t:CDS:1, partial [Cetraspora pellucida]